MSEVENKDRIEEEQSQKLIFLKILLIKLINL